MGKETFTILPITGFENNNIHTGSQSGNYATAGSVCCMNVIINYPIDETFIATIPSHI